MPSFDERLLAEHVRGASLAELSRTHNMPPEAIRQHLDRLLTMQHVASRSMAVSIEVARYDALLRTYMPRALGGDLESAQLMLAVSRDRRKLLGLDAPTAITADVTLTATDIEAVVARILADVPAVPPLTIEAEETFPLPDVSPAVTGRATVLHDED